MDSFESRMYPRFLAESEKGMLWEPRVIESGRGTVGFKEDEKGKRRASVLLSFSLSWFSFIHVFMSSVHALRALVRLVTSLRGADFWSCVSSAKSWWFTGWSAMISERGVVYRMKRKGLSTEPWGTPYMSRDGDEDKLLTEVDWSVWEVWVKPLECSRLNAKNSCCVPSEMVTNVSHGGTCWYKTQRDRWMIPTHSEFQMHSKLGWYSKQN